MNVVENVVKTENVVENSENVEKVVERKAENQNGNQNGLTKAKTLAELLERKMKALNVDLSEIELLNVLTAEISVINEQIEKLNAEKLKKMNEAKKILESLNDEAKRILEILGLINVAEIEKVIGGKTQIAKTQTIRAEKGNGLSGKKIVYNGKMYNIAQYFMQKFGIKGGLFGLEQWAKERGLSVKVEDDVIYIL